MKINIILDLSKEEDAHEYELFKRMVNMDRLLTFVEQDIFRPARKHGYPDREIQDLLGENGEELIGKLEKAYYEAKCELMES